MKSSNQGSGNPSISWGNGYVTSCETPDRIVGRVIGVIEAIGLPDKQEESVKGLIRAAIWDIFSDAVYITPERHTEIKEMYFAKRRENGTDVPMSAI